MKKVYFRRKENIDKFLTTKFNVRAYKQLTEKKVFKGLFEPLHFFNLLYENLETLLNNRHKPPEFSDDLINLDLKIGQLLFLLYKLKEFVSMYNKKENDMQLYDIIYRLNFEINVTKKKFRNEKKIVKSTLFQRDQESVKDDSTSDSLMRFSQAFEDFFIKRQEKGSKPVPKENDFNFINNFDDVSESDVYNYFKEKLVKKKLLSEEDLRSYLISAFQEKKPPEKLFEMNIEITKLRIYKIFYIYYKNKAHKPHGKRNEYVNLLSEYFKGFNHKTIASNWSK